MAASKPGVFKVWINYDGEVKRWSVAKTQFRGLILVDAEPGRF